MHLAQQHSAGTAARHYQVTAMLSAQEQAQAFHTAVHGDITGATPVLPPAGNVLTYLRCIYDCICILLCIYDCICILLYISIVTSYYANTSTTVLPDQPLILPRKRRRTEWAEEEKTWLLAWAKLWREGNPQSQFNWRDCQRSIEADSVARYSSSIYFTLLYSTIPHPTLLHSTLPHLTLPYSTITIPTLLPLLYVPPEIYFYQSTRARLLYVKHTGVRRMRILLTRRTK